VPKKPKVGFTIAKSAWAIVDGPIDLVVSGNVITNNSEINIWEIYDLETDNSVVLLDPYMLFSLNELDISKVYGIRTDAGNSNGSLKYQTTELFQGTNVFGDTNYGSAGSAFLAGGGNAAGGDGATLFGTRNRGVYGNIISGGDNFSNGLHSIILGRFCSNLGSYNVITNLNNDIKFSSIDDKANFLAGQDNIISGGSASFGGGKANKIQGN